MTENIESRTKKMTLTGTNTTALKNVIKIHGNAEDKKNTEIIDVNIRTNFTMSNSRNSKFVHKLLFIIVFFFTGIFTVLLFTVRKELQALKSQEQCIEDKIAILVTKYEKVSNQLSRVRSHMNHQKFYQPPTTSDEYDRHANRIYAPHSKGEIIAKYNEMNNFELSSSQSDKPDVLSGARETPEAIAGNYAKNNSSLIQKDDFGDSAVSDGNAKFNLTANNNIRSGNRFTRMILNTTVGNYQTMDQPVDRSMADTGSNLYVNNPNDQIAKNWQNDDNIDLRSEPRTARTRRDDDRRGKIRTKRKRRPNRSRRRLGPRVATFIGGIPEQRITDTGAIGPWVKMVKNTSHYDLQKFHIVENKKAIEITMNGLYMISAQMFYFGQQTNFSYWILLSSEGQSNTQRVTKCSAVSSAASNEVSCHTTVVLSLRRGDRLHVQQQERNRLVNLREGHSYIQLVLLSDESQRRHHLD